MTIITSTEQLMADWFTAVLRKSGALIQGSVVGFETEGDTSVNAHIVDIQLRYALGSTGALPTKLFLKMCEGGGTFGPSEVDYYSRDYVDLKDAPIPCCYDAVYSVEQQRYHILMDDLGDTHRNNWGVAPTLAYGRAVAEGLAALHAHWWGASRLRTGEHTLPSAAVIDRYIEHIRPGLAPMLESIQGEADPAWAGALRDIFKHHPAKMIERTANPDGFTLIHGDPNPGNILSPIAGATPVYIVDRQPFDWSLTTWLGVSDIAYMMVHWWETDLRRQLEFQVLRRYHESLVGRGVSGYTWEQLVDDYNLCAVQSIYVATEWCVHDEDRTNMRWVWLPQLQKAMAAFFDLRCAELWI